MSFIERKKSIKSLSVGIAKCLISIIIAIGWSCVDIRLTFLRQ